MLNDSSLIDPCLQALKQLSARKLATGNKTTKALVILAGAFTDVPVNYEPMPLTEQQANELRLDFAQELTRHLTTLKNLPADTSPEVRANLVQLADSAWLALTATVWPLLMPIEQRRVQVAQVVVSQVAGEIAREEGLDIKSALMLLRDVLTDPTWPGHDGSIDGFMSMGVGPHVAVTVIDATLEHHV